MRTSFFYGVGLFGHGYLDRDFTAARRTIARLCDNYLLTNGDLVVVGVIVAALSK